MFRTKTHCDRYDFTSFELNTHIKQPEPGAIQSKEGYNFTIEDRTSYYDWYKAYLNIRFKVVKMDNTPFGANDRIAPISDAASLISNLRVSLNGKTLYDCINTYRMTHIKNLLTKSVGYTNTIATNEFYFPDERRTTVIDKAEDDYNKGFHDRQLSIIGGKEETAIIPLNKFSFFESLSTNILPPSQVKLEVRLTEDSTALYKSEEIGAGAVADGKVIVTELVLWVPMLELKAEGMRLIMERYLSSNYTWSYLCEATDESTSGRQVERTWRISADVTKPRHVFVYLQKDDKNINQKENVHIFETFSMGHTKLVSARLEVSGNLFYPKSDYSTNDIGRIYRDVIEYSHIQDNKHTSLFLTRDRFMDLYGMLYFNLTYNSGKLDIDPVQLIIRFKLNQAPNYDYKAFAIILYERTVMVNMVGNEISVV